MKGPVVLEERQIRLGSGSKLTIATEIKSEADLFGPGAQPGTVPTDLEQSTGLERLEILGKMDGVDIFDMRPLDASRLGKQTGWILGDAGSAG